MSFNAFADAGQRRAEFQHAVVLGLVSHSAPARVIAVLLATASITAARLNVTVRQLADPHVGPGRRNRERLDPRENRIVVHWGILPVDVHETRACHAAADAGTRIADVA